MIAAEGRRADAASPKDDGDGYSEPFGEKAPVRSFDMSAIQRHRIIYAVTQMVADDGLCGVTVTAVVARAGISRRTFYEHFRNRDDCLLGALDYAVEKMSEPVLVAYEGADIWLERIRASLAALLCFLDDEPLLGRLLVADTLVGSRPAHEHRDRLVGYATAAIDEGRRGGSGRVEPPGLAAEGAVGGVLAVLHKQMLGQRQDPLLSLLGSLMAIIVLPYRGAAAARAELERPALDREPKRLPDRARSLSAMPMRVTYRTIRVLLALAEQPGCSNRDASLAAGIPDQGQISKLLGRLERLGLIENHSDRHPGSSNAWHLSEHGSAVVAAADRTAVPDRGTGGRGGWIFLDF